MRIIMMSVVLFLFFSGCNSSSSSDSSSSQETNNPSQEKPSNPSSSENNPESNETSPNQPSPEDTNDTSSLPIAIELSLDALELKEGSSLPLHVKGIDTHTNLQWSISNPQLVSITDNNTLNALKEGSVSLSVSTDKVQSNTLHVSIYKEIHGHRLPPEPDPKINNSTLLGIDVNGNGVRDDVERWIYEEYKDKHPVHVDIAMQAGRAYKKVLEMPIQNTEQAKKIHEQCIAPIACKAYYQIYAKYFNEPLLATEDMSVTYFQKLYFNTKNRKEIYENYSKLLSGNVYTTPKLGEGKNLCDFNTSKYEE
jgi:hypothetical protein